MSKKEALHLQKMSRNDRFAQMSHQEKIIEQKKKEILAKLEAKKNVSETSSSEDASNSSADAEMKSLNAFHNDGSFLNTFKTLKEKKVDSKHRSFKHKDYSDDRGNKLSKWGQKPNSSPKDRSKPINRLPDKNPSFEQQKITINTCFKNSVNQQTLDINPPPKTVFETPQSTSVAPPVKIEEISPPNTVLPVSQVHTVISSQSNMQVILPQPVLFGVPASPQLQTHNLIIPPESVKLEPITLENFVQNQIPMSSVPTVELANIPPPNPIQIQNIPQPGPINALNIPQPAPIQVQNIPTPASLQLNEIPNPQPLDLMAIPTPNEKSLSEAEFLKNIPPPNKSVPPPTLGEGTMNIPPPPPPNCISMVNVQPQQNIRNIPTSSGVMMHGIQQSNQQIQNLQQHNFSPVISVALPPNSVSVSNAIPALMAQPILPPPGLSMSPQVNISCPPPILTMNTPTVQLQGPPPGYLGQVPPQMSQMPPMNIPPPPPGLNALGGGNAPDIHTVFPPGTADYEAMASLARMVAQCGPSVQEVVQQRKKQDPSLWFLFHKGSAAYKQYQQLVEKFKQEMQEDSLVKEEYKPEDAYEPEGACEDDDRNMDFQENSNSRKRRRSRWGEKAQDVPTPTVLPPVPMATPIVPLPMNQPPGQVMLSKITRTDPALLQYAKQTFNTLNLTEEEWKKAEDHYKINLLYQDMVRKREEADRLRLAGKNKYDYDSDEETEGGTWEHRIREKEMTATQLWADELTRQAEGKHHIGDFLPPEEFKRFMEKTNAAKEGIQLNFSDYKEFKIKEDNIGFKMLQKLGWTEGTGLGSEGTGIMEPVNKAASRDLNQGLGLNSEEFDNDDDEYESYRKRMMLAYRFRPNPLNNPRRPYY